MRQGNSFSGVVLEHLNDREISILSCSLDWIADTKGFYQPVYCFELQKGEQETIKDYVPALKWRLNLLIILWGAYLTFISSHDILTIREVNFPYS